MTSNTIRDQQKLIIDPNENPPPYQTLTNIGTDSYGTFIGDVQTPTTAATTSSSYSYGFSLQSPSVIVLGGCPACKAGMLETDFTCLGLCCAILFFPVGILCCLALRQRRCQFCGAIFN